MKDNDDFRQISQSNMSLSLSSSSENFKVKNGELFDESHFLTPSAASMSASLPEHLMGSASEHAQKAILLSNNSLVQRICSEIHSLGDSLPLGSSSEIYLDIIWAVPPQCAASSSCLCYSATDPRSLGLYGALRHLITKTGGMGGCCITIAEVYKN